MENWKFFEQYEEIRELTTNNIALQGSFNDIEKSIDQVILSLNRSGFRLKRFPHHVRELQDTEHVLQEAAAFKDPEFASSEVSGQIFKSSVNRNRASQANFASRNVANS